MVPYKINYLLCPREFKYCRHPESKFNIGLYGKLKKKIILSEISKPFASKQWQEVFLYGPLQNVCFFLCCS